MSRKIKSKEPSIFRLMYISIDCKNNNHVDFQTKEEALDYANNLNSSLIEWYGIYELDPICNYMKRIVSNRLIKYNNIIDIDKFNNKKVKHRKLK